MQSNTSPMGKTIKRWILENEMTQAEYAEKVGITPASLCRYIAGERMPRLKTLHRMCEVMGLSIAELAGGTWDGPAKEDPYETILYQLNLIKYGLTDEQRMKLIKTIFKGVV